jgi:hypothetical protein
MARLFLAYAHEDLEKARRLVADLERRQGVSVWFAERDLRSGDNVRDAILTAIEEADVFLLAVSPATAARGETSFMARERSMALRRRRADPDFELLTVRFGRGPGVPEGFGRRVAVDLSKAGKWDRGVKRIADALQVGEDQQR